MNYQEYNYSYYIILEEINYLKPINTLYVQRKKLNKVNVVWLLTILLVHLELMLIKNKLNNILKGMISIYYVEEK